jgi:hypothetical protein
MLAGFAHVVLEIRAQQRSVIDRVLDAHPAVLALSPAGERIRAVVAASAVGDVTRVLQDVGAVSRAATPDFEDLVLSLIAGGEKSDA